MGVAGADRQTPAGVGSMRKMKVWIYRPDMANRVDPACLYDYRGQNYYDWKRDEETLYREKLEKIREKLNNPPDYQVHDYWR